MKAVPEKNLIWMLNTYSKDISLTQNVCKPLPFKLLSELFTKLAL